MTKDVGRDTGELSSEGGGCMCADSVGDLEPG
jgi:hypothetical protein